MKDTLPPLLFSNKLYHWYWKEEICWAVHKPAPEKPQHLPYLFCKFYIRKTTGTWPKHIKALILTPTRELAIQIDESFAAYGKYTGLTHTVIFGGVSQLHQTNHLKSGVDILIATPGRLLDLMSQGFIDLQHLKIFVLDEADRMLDMGFIHDVKRVIIKLPAKRQTFFSRQPCHPKFKRWPMCY